VRKRTLVATMILLQAPLAAGQDLGTLFHSPEERARLDRLRRGEPTQPAQSGGVRPGTRQSLTGFVQRSDGRATVWIDGSPLSVATPSARKLDPAEVRAYSEDPDGVKIERKPAR
jgi:hypothetical protein